MKDYATKVTGWQFSSYSHPSSAPLATGKDEEHRDEVTVAYKGMTIQSMYQEMNIHFLIGNAHLQFFLFFFYHKSFWGEITKHVKKSNNKCCTVFKKIVSAFASQNFLILLELSTQVI